MKPCANTSRRILRGRQKPPSCFTPCSSPCLRHCDAKSAKVKTRLVAANVGESVVTVSKDDRTTLAVLGRKIIAAMRQRKRKAGVETASEGTRAIRDGR
jgi:hypothetical protein